MPFYRLDKKTLGPYGRLLDGEIHDAMPEVEEADRV